MHHVSCETGQRIIVKYHGASVLEEKGQIKHQEEGLKYVYAPVVTRDKAKRSAVKPMDR